MARGTVLVTGTSSGIGRASALHLATLGFDVLAGVRSLADGASVQSLRPDRITPVELDVTDRDQIAAVRARVEESGLYGLVNNAGVTVQGAIEFLDPEELRRQLDINVVGQMALTQAVLPQLRAVKGRIVMVSSIGGRMAFPFLSPYHASKFALEGLSDSLRMELKPFGVHVAVIEPGSVKTEIWRKGTESGRATLAEMPPEGQALYGRRLEAMMKTGEKTGNRGIEPVEVAEAIAHALTASRPKTRYLVGSDARAQAAMKWLLPDRVLDALTRRLSGT